MRIHQRINLGLTQLELSYQSFREEIEDIRKAIKEDYDRRRALYEIEDVLKMLEDVKDNSLERDNAYSLVKEFLEDQLNSGQQMNFGLISKTAQWFLDTMEREWKMLSKESEFEALCLKSDMLNNFSNMWSIYRETCTQRHPALLYSLIKKSLQNIRIADRLVFALFDNNKRNLYLENEQPPIVVPFMTQTCITGFQSPIPVIVARSLGHKQVWTWLSYVHELGHYMYRNIKGLCHELRVKVMISLVSDPQMNKRIEYEMLGIWFNWLEEIFADTFGLLLIGEEFKQSMTWMLLHIPSEVIYQLKTGGSNPKKGLLQATDLTHPVPFLRTGIASEALGIMEISNQDEDKLWEYFVDAETETVNILIRDEKHCLKFIDRKTEDMEYARKVVVKVILEEPLYALADKGNPNEPRCLKDVFLEDREQRNTQVKNAGDAIIRQLENGGATSTEGYKIQHLLSAAQKKLMELAKYPEQNPAEGLNALSDAVFKVIRAKTGLI